MRISDLGLAIGPSTVAMPGIGSPNEPRGRKPVDCHHTLPRCGLLDLRISDLGLAIGPSTVAMPGIGSPNEPRGRKPVDCLAYAGVPPRDCFSAQTRLQTIRQCERRASPDQTRTSAVSSRLFWESGLRWCTATGLLLGANQTSDDPPVRTSSIPRPNRPATPLPGTKERESCISPGQVTVKPFGPRAWPSQLHLATLERTWCGGQRPHYPEQKSGKVA